MNSILAKTTRRQLKLIEILFEKDDWVTIGQLSKDVLCSTRVIHNDILAINLLYFPFQIDTSSLKGIMLTFPDNMSIDYIYRLVLEQSIEFNLLEQLLFEKVVLVSDYCSELHVSQSTFTRIIKRINQKLNLTDIFIESSPYFLKGNEHGIRTMFVHLFLEKYEEKNYPFTASQVESIDTLIYYVAQMTQTHLNFPDMKLLRAILLVSITRISKGHHVETKTLSAKEDELITKVSSDRVTVQTFYKQFGVTLTTEVLKELFAIFLFNNSLNNVADLRERLNNPSSVSFNEISGISAFLDKLSYKLSVPLINKEELTLEIFNLHLLFFGQNFILFDKKAQFASQIKREYPRFYKILKAELLEFKFYPTFLWDEAGFNEILYTIIIHWENLQKELNRNILPVKIGIFCDYDIEHSNFLKGIMSFHFRNHVEISLFKSLTEKQAIKESSEFEIIITNISNLFCECDSVICINSVPTIHNWKSLMQIVSVISDEKNLITATPLP